MEFFSEERKQGRPAGLRAVRRAFCGGMGSKKGGEACEMSVEPGFEGKPSGERGSAGDC